MGYHPSSGVGRRREIGFKKPTEECKRMQCHSSRGGYRFTGVSPLQTVEWFVFQLMDIILTYNWTHNEGQMVPWVVI